MIFFDMYNDTNKENRKSQVVRLFLSDYLNVKQLDNWQRE
jgi:hypothetical protein